ncbi:MAG TPA: ATP-binding protein [Dongiaceae bacterium]|nr:ATP-binding protein [Dongiaceae bacterium]
MTRIPTLRPRLIVVTILFLATGPALGMIFSAGDLTNVIWLGLLIGALALTVAWAAWSDSFFQQTTTLTNTARRLAEGDLHARTGMGAEAGDLCRLAEAIDLMAGSLEAEARERERAERTLLNRTHQQTVIAAMGQFALAYPADFDGLLDQAVNFITQTLELEYCGIWEVTPGGEQLGLRTGTGWKQDYTGSMALPLGPGSLVDHLFTSGGTAMLGQPRQETRFRLPPVLVDHGVVSGVGVVIAGGTWPYGVLGVASTVERQFTEDEVHFLLATATVIAMAINRQHTEMELQKLASFARLNPNPVMEFAADGSLTYFNDAAMNMATHLGLDHPRALISPEIRQIIQECLTTGQSKLRHETRPHQRVLSWSFFPVTTNRVVHCYAADITDRLNLEAQLRQSQKMESVGQLAAGVAHDFNNMLTIIQGHSGVIMARPNLPVELSDSAQAIYFASERAASLTRQLLLFSRKNIMLPRLLDLKEVMGNMTKMLQRLIGENIRLHFEPPAALPAINGDAGMIEQVIMNLVVNARDAMVHGGTLTLKLKTETIAPDRVQLHPQSRPGSFVCIEVTDTGSGMSPETQARIFEPFFTTKEVGKGTGLGLATVYGIVKQHEGWIEVNSEVGVGTTFQIFLPASETAIPAARPPETAAPAPATQIRGGKETVLIVEDEAVLRDLANLILQEQGYRTLQAGNGIEALRVWEREQNNIDLLLTDMMMPEGMSGKELAERLQKEKTGLKVVCVSGYSVEDVDHQHITFLQKPYTRFSLAKTVRDCLDGVTR